MATPYYHLKVITPKGLSLETDTVHAEIPEERGYVGVLANHAAFVTVSPGGRLTLRGSDGIEKKYQIGPGFFEINQNQAALLTQSFQVV